MKRTGIFLCTYYTRHCIYTVLLNPNNVMKKVSIAPFYSGGTRMSEFNFTRITWLVGKNICSKTFVLCIAIYCFPYVLCQGVWTVPCEGTVGYEQKHAMI